MKKGPTFIDSRHQSIDYENDLFVIITERDSPDFWSSSGAIVGEIYTQKGSFSDVMERAKCLGDRYGKIHIARLQIITGIDITKDYF